MSACEGISQNSEAERRIAAEQAAIKAYSDEVPKVDALGTKNSSQVWTLTVTQTFTA